MGTWAVGRMGVRGEPLQSKAPAGPSSAARPLTHFSHLKETQMLFHIQIYWASEDCSPQEKLLSSIFQTGDKPEQPKHRFGSPTGETG